MSRRPVLAGLIATVALLGVPEALAADATVGFRYTSYSPSAIRIAPGESVTWTSTDGSTFTNHPLRFVDDKAPQQDTGTTATIPFAAAGIYDFYCNVHASMTGEIRVTTNHPPSASFSAPSAGDVNTVVSFDGTASSDPDSGQALTYIWHWGDGSADEIGPQATKTHMFTGTGNFTVRLTVTDSNSDAVGPESTQVSHVIAVSDPNAGTTTTTAGTTTATTTTPPPNGDGETTPAPPLPTISIGAGAVPRLAKLLAKGLKVSFDTSAGGTVDAKLVTGRVMLARAKATVGGGGTHRLLVRATAAAKRRLRLARKLRATLTLAFTTSLGTADAHRRLTLKR